MKSSDSLFCTTSGSLEFFKNWQNCRNSNLIELCGSIKSVDTSYIRQNDTYITENTITKSQFKPLKRGISNMIRIQSDKVISLPADTRIRVLASSKDIIHSWSVPAAGIKIDCIPGYTSHRVLVFSLPGVYWGQCMEICGRFHHWMPIVVYLIRKDSFCTWCVHFLEKPSRRYPSLSKCGQKY